MSAALGLLVLVVELLRDLTVPNQAALWFAVAALSFGLTAIGTRQA
jgi:hypothetical protein